MRDVGIKKVVYSTDDDFVIEKVKDMKKTHISKGTKRLNELKQI